MTKKTMLNRAVLAALLAVVLSTETSTKRTGCLKRVWRNVTSAENDIRELFGYYRQIMLSLDKIPNGYIGSKCHEDSNCYILGSECIDSKCACATEDIFSSKQAECLTSQGYIGSSCHLNSDCNVDKSVCYDNKCVCDPGLLYSSEQGGCLEREACTKLADTYTELRGYYIGSNNEKTINADSTNCKQACNMYDWCLSADVRSSDNRCDLAKVTLDEQNEYIVDKYKMSHFSRNCAN